MRFLNNFNSIIYIYGKINYNRYLLYFLNHPIEKEGEFIKLDEHSFTQDYDLRGTTFQVRFDWAEYNGKTIITWIDENTNTRIPGNAGDPSALLIQFVFASKNDSGDYIESYCPMLLNIRTGELTDILAGTGAGELECIGNSAISDDLILMNA